VIAVREDVALSQAFIGDVDAAREAVTRLLAAPAHFSPQTCRLDPRWDDLRARIGSLAQLDDRQ
jgi:hypothetical protein